MFTPSCISWFRGNDIPGTVPVQGARKLRHKKFPVLKNGEMHRRFNHFLQLVPSDNVLAGNS
jgi:hypothetical protein